MRAPAPRQHPRPRLCPRAPRPAAGVLVVYVTAPSADVALSIAEQLVAQQLVACVNVVSGVTSIYNWKV